ncbi:MAG: hypothetical protein GIKADHBN_01081 [Phycisphaerales bacterium]|nr:hypothetical protein [Phycisphaerales bacterium]
MGFMMPPATRTPTSFTASAAAASNWPPIFTRGLIPTTSSSSPTSTIAVMPSRIDHGTMCT